jgi:hypothetical protein
LADEAQAAGHRRAIDAAAQKAGQLTFARGSDRCGLTPQSYARLVRQRVASTSLDPAKIGTQSLRRTKAVPIYRQTGDLRAVELSSIHCRI